ncbi:MAG: hypothetical protein ACOYB7_13860 [Mycobacterium sp.]
MIAPPPGPPPPPIAWPLLGRPDRLDILGSDQPVDTDIPIPPGVTPGVLTGQIGSVVNIVGGRIDVRDGRGVILGSIPAPPDQSSVPFAIDISGAQIVAGVATLSFILRDQNPPADSCSRPPSLTLSQLGSSFLGQTPYPARVSDFKPGYVEQIIIRVSPAPTIAQQQAALELVAMFTRYYRPMPVRVDIDTSPDLVAPGPPTRRVIELREASVPDMTVQNGALPEAVLVISGRGSELSQQVQLFADRRVELAQTTSAVVKSATAEVPRGTTVKTFAQLRMAGDISVLGNTTLYVGFDTSEFTVGPVQQANLRLIAHYTPVSGGEASVIVRSGNTVLATRRLDESGLLDITGTIPPESIQSTVGVALQLRYLPSQRCAPLNDRMQFTLDPASTVAVTPGSHNRGGFPVLPMAFTPEFSVAIDQPDHLQYAAQAINLLGQQTAVTLQPHLVSLPEAATSGLGALVVARGEDLASRGLTPPLLSQGANSVDIEGVPATEVDLNGPVGVIQAFSNHGRMVLAIGSSQDWTLVERCFDYIRAQPSRWASLTGDVVATGSAGQSVNLTLREGGALINEYPGDTWKWWTWLTSGAVSAAILTSAGILLWRRRVRRERR